VVNLRGTLVPMIDVRARWGAPPADIDPGQVFLVARCAGQAVALLADEVEDIVEISGATAKAPEVRDSAAVVGGLAGSSGAAVVILDVERLLDGTEIGRLTPVVASGVGDGAREGGGFAARESPV
jgi:purine-binding chemotaxis protein CheW